MGIGHLEGSHFAKPDFCPEQRRLPGRLAPCKPAADNCDLFHNVLLMAFLEEEEISLLSSLIIDSADRLLV
jgi:hypothetical protein